jgi:hypothetical protein
MTEAHQIMPGAVAATLLAGMLLTVPVSFTLRWWFSRMVLKSMQAPSGAGVRSISGPATPAPVRASGPAPASLSLLVSDAASAPPPSAESPEMLKRVLRGPWSSVVPYGLAGAAYAAVAMVLVLWADGLEFFPRRMLFVWYVLLWPVVPTIYTIAAPDLRRRALVGGLYLLVGLIISLGHWVDFGTLWAIWVLPPTLSLLAFSNRRIRAIGPLVLIVILAAFAGANIALQLVSILVEQKKPVLTQVWLLIPLILFFAATAWYLVRRKAFRALALVAITIAVAELFFLAQLGSVLSILFQNVIGLVAGAMVLFGFAGSLVLNRLTEAYRNKRLSDQMITVDTQWLIFAIYQAIDLFFSNKGYGVAALGLVPFLVYKIVLWFALKPHHRESLQYKNIKLLLLRVFGEQKRSERLMGNLGLNWRHVGSIQLIAGTDLALANLEPHEFIEFVSGRLNRQFINDEKELERRLETIDGRPDPDGRFRVNEFFCHDDTWQLTVSRLALESDAVLMDLRRFSPERQGCVYELHQLLSLMPLSRITLLVDGTTDMPFLERTVQDGWLHLDDSSPNRGETQPQLRISRVTKGNTQELRNVLASLCRGATSDHGSGALHQQPN